MPKKRTFSKQKKDRRRSRAPQDTRKPKKAASLENAILAFIARHDGPASLAEIRRGIGEFEPSRKEAEQAVAELLARKELAAAGKKRFQLDKRGNLFSGTVEKHPKGFGFVVGLEPAPPARFFDKDPFLSIRAIGTANHGDTVLIRIRKVRSDGRPEAELVAVLERFAESITGFYRPGSPPRVIPEDPRYPSTIVIEGSIEKEIHDNDVVVVQVLPGPSKTGFVRGEIIEVLGSARDIDVQMRMVVEKFDLPHRFADAALEEADTFTPPAGDHRDRLDLRDILHITIDGETAKDFDDAIAVEKTRHGYRLYVSIADVSHYVRPGTALDKEAYLRGTSIYFPGRVIPMLPERLSNDLCSLVPDEERLAFSAVLDFDRRGTLRKKDFGKSVIRSHHRFTYTTVRRIVIDGDAEARKNHTPYLTMLKWAKELAVELHARRMERGSIGFNIPEPEITLDDDGKIQSIKRKERNFAHQIIEEFMLAANEAVAQTFSSENLDFIYRIHEKPAPEKVEEFADFAKTLGIELPEVSATPEWFARVLEIVRDQPAEYVVNNLLLRTMQQARYDPYNAGHFGLAADNYTHFTSPIRRYPDLMVHRFLQAYLSGQPKPNDTGESSLKEKTSYLSNRERTAVSAEREMGDRLKIFFMEEYIGQSFAAVISGVGETVLFVELIDLFISGSIDVTVLTDDYYLYDPGRHWLIGDVSGKTYQLGDLIEVVLLDVDFRRQRINFAPV